MVLSFENVFERVVKLAFSKLFKLITVAEKTTKNSKGLFCCTPVIGIQVFRKPLDAYSPRVPINFDIFTARLALMQVHDHSPIRKFGQNATGLFLAFLKKTCHSQSHPFIN